MKHLVIMSLMMTSCVVGMETNINAPSVTIKPQKIIMPDYPNTIDIPTLWAKYNVELNRQEKSAAKITMLFNCLLILTAMDKPFLSEAQGEEWDIIFKNSQLGLISNMSFFSKTTELDYKFFDEQEECMYPINNCLNLFKTIKWAKEKIQASECDDIAWPRIFDLKGYSEKSSFTNQEILKKRLKILKKEKQKVQAELLLAQNSVPEKFPEFGITKIGDLWDSLCSTKNNESERLRTFCAYMTVLMKSDFQWFNKLEQAALSKLIAMQERRAWGSSTSSRTYYRFTLGAIDRAIKTVEQDAFSINLSWVCHFTTRDLINSKIKFEPLYFKIEELRESRLAALNKQKEEAFELLQNYEKRKALNPKIDSDKPSNCITQ